jgi:dTMP kinase
VLYLRLNIDDLITRVIQTKGFDYWESGMDLHLGADRYDSFVEYQKRLLAQFDSMVEAYGFEVVDASGSIEEVFDDLKRRISRVVDADPPGGAKGRK